MAILTKLEGIIINKIPYREKDLILKILLRNSEQITLIFYGGRGGGKNKKGSVLDLGNAIKVELKPEKILSNDKILSAKEYSLIYRHESIRYDVRAFYLLNFFSEIVTKIAPTTHLTSEYYLSSQEMESKSTVEYFRILSNAIYYLDDSVKNKNLDIFSHSFIFLVKLIYESGISPNLNDCIFCEEPLIQFSFLEFKTIEGGFSCQNCIHNEFENSSSQVNDHALYELFKMVYQLKYQNYQSVNNSLLHKFNKQLLNYFFSHFHLENSHFRSIEFLNF